MLPLGFIFPGNQTKPNNKVTSNELKEIIIKNNYKNNIVYTYTAWCSPCVKEFPNIIEFCKKNSCKLYILILSKDGNADLEKYKKIFKEKYNFNDLIYNYSYDKKTSEGLKKSNNFVRESNYINFQSFMKLFLESYYTEDLIYGSDNLILLNNKAEIKFISSSMTYENIYKQLKKNIIE